MAKQEKRALIVTLSGDRGIHEVTRDLKAAGLDVEQVLEATNIVTGAAGAKSLSRLKKVPGVADVSHDHPVDIGPPDAEVS
jgi:hypothetical protein